MVRKLCCSLLPCLFFCLTAAARQDTVGAGTQVPGHPRILWLKGGESRVRQTVSQDATWRKVHQSILTECEALERAPLLKRELEGRRLLGVSRECLRRVFFLSYAWRMTGNRQYLQRAEKELLAVCAFSNWNPSHFLDVAEMTMGVAIGYDWLFDALSPEAQAIIREAILQKGIRPSLETRNNGWLRASHNWNQVCNAGMLYGALAVYENEPALAGAVINRGIRSIVLPMEDYQPDGAYPEGYGYWGYGTSFNVLFINALEKAFGKDFGLTRQPGFLQTAGFLEHMTGATGNAFNYSDAGNGGGLQPAMFWFAAQRKDPSLLWVERSRLEREAPAKHLKNRLLPAILLWGNGIRMADIKAPSQLFWTGGGKTPVALMRTSWTDSNAIYVGFKAGSASVNHAHMDAGSFVMEAAGVRWGIDLGMQDYNSLESKGVKIWDKNQQSQRWQVYRYNNYAHSTLTIDDSLQRVAGDARLISHGDARNMMFATADLSGVYAGQLLRAQRGVAVMDREYVLVRDEIEAGDKGAMLRWTLVTPAEVTITGTNTAELRKNGKTLGIKVVSPLAVRMKAVPAVSQRAYDAPNPGVTLTGFEVTLPANYKGSIDVLLVPGGLLHKNYKMPGQLNAWGRK